jgi:hypothetical protein
MHLRNYSHDIPIGSNGSRKAAGILISYEALVRHFVAFGGATKEGVEKGTKA